MNKLEPTPTDRATADAIARARAERFHAERDERWGVPRGTSRLAVEVMIAAALGDMRRTPEQAAAREEERAARNARLRELMAGMERPGAAVAEVARDYWRTRPSAREFARIAATAWRACAGSVDPVGVLELVGAEMGRRR